MIYIFFGAPGAGKTSLMTRFAVEAMTDRKIRRGDLRACGAVLDNYNAGGYRFTRPENHLVFADYPIVAKLHPYRVSYAIKGEIAVPTGEAGDGAYFFPPGARIFLDEAQRKLNSRNGGISMRESAFFELHRHNDYTVYMTAQREELIDLNARALTSHIYEVRGMTHRYSKFGRIIQTTWDCLLFDNCFSVKKYLDGGKDTDLGKPVRITHDGDIFRCYDAKEHRAAFFVGREGADFDLEEARFHSYSLASVKSYGALHPLPKNKTKKE